MTDPTPAPEAPAPARRWWQVQPSGLERQLAAWAWKALAPRMGLWLWVSVALLVLVWWLAQHMLAVILYKVVIITIAAFVGDKISRAAEKSNKRPHEFIARANDIWEHLAGTHDPMPTDVERRDAMDHAHHLEDQADRAYLRRAIVIGACVIAGALGS